MRLELDNGNLKVTLQGMERVWSLKGSVTIPLANITEVQAKEPSDKPSNYWAALRMPGTFVPWVIKAGTYYSSIGTEFWYATVGNHFLVLYLNGRPYNRIVLGIKDADMWAQRLQAAMAK